MQTLATNLSRSTGKSVRLQETSDEKMLGDLEGRALFTCHSSGDFCQDVLYYAKSTPAMWTCEHDTFVEKIVSVLQRHDLRAYNQVFLCDEGTIVFRASRNTKGRALLVRCKWEFGIDLGEALGFLVGCMVVCLLFVWLLVNVL